MTFLTDLAHVVRHLWRSPSFVITATLTLALGVGANTAIFSVINGFMRPLPVPHPEQIVVLATTMAGDETGLRFRFSFPAVQDYRARAQVFSDVFAFDVRIAGLGVDGKTTPFVHQAVTGNYFEALGLTPAAGRLFAAGEGERRDADLFVVLGYTYWQKRFGGRDSAIGTFVKVDGSPAQIIGVAPKGFKGLSEGAEMDGYVPLSLARRFDPRNEDLFTDRTVRRFTMVARMKPDVSVEEAQAAVTTLAARLVAEYPVEEKGTGARVIPEPHARPLPWPVLSNLLPLVRYFLLVLSLVVLLIACLNVANILLVRVTVREREMAVRASLGAGRAGLMRLLLIESLVLAVLGTALGLVIGRAISVMFVDSVTIGMDIPFRLDAHFDWRVFTYSAVAAIVTGLVVGALPARRASRTSITHLLHDGGRSGSTSRARMRVRNALVVAQVAGSLVLLIIAGLFVRNLARAQQVDLGFDSNQVVTARLDTLNIGLSEERSAAFYDELHRRLRAIPGVESASLSFNVPLGWIIGSYIASAEDQPDTGDAPKPAIGCNSVSPEYFAALKIPIVHGRGFTSADSFGSTRVAIVNQVLSDRWWPGQDPIGKRISVPATRGDPWEVVGVAATTKYMAVFEGPLPFFYVPQAQNPSRLRSILVRSSMPADEMKLRIEREVIALEPELPVADLQSLDDLIAGNIGFVLFRVGAWQATVMGLLGLALAVIGVYGVVSYQTSQREKEIGIRMALGAVPADVKRLVLGQGAGLVLAGAAIGLVLSLAVTLALGRMLVMISATDPLTFGVITALLCASALLACYLPARRATRVQPVEALRHE